MFTALATSCRNIVRRIELEGATLSKVMRLSHIIGSTALGVAIGLLFLQILQSELPTGVLRIAVPFGRVVRQLLPQGWSFFTRDPRESRFVFVTRDIKGHHLIGPTSILDVVGSGFSRRGRRRNAELVASLNGKRDLNWVRCAEEYLPSCLATKQVTSRSSVCVDTFVVRYSQVAWQRAAYRTQWRDSVYYALMGGSCN